MIVLVVDTLMYVVEGPKNGFSGTHRHCDRRNDHFAHQRPTDHADLPCLSDRRTPGTPPITTPLTIYPFYK